jgi:hypothetical protein
VSVEGQEIGHVEGFLVTGAQVTHVVVESDLSRTTRAAALPIDSVESIETDRITVRASEDVLDSLPRLRSHWFRFF